MTISLVGTPNGANVQASAGPSYPTGIASGDLVLTLLGWKPTTETAPTAVSGWTSRANISSGATVAGIDSGSERAAVYQKDTVGAETGTVTWAITSSTNSNISAAICAFRSSLGAWNAVETTTASTDVTTTGARTVTGAATLALTTGDWLVVNVAYPTDTAPTVAPSVTVASCTLSSQHNQNSSSAAGGDGLMYRIIYAVTAGTATGAPVVSWTAGTTGNAVTAATFTRLSEATAMVVAGTAAQSVGALTATNVLGADLAGAAPVSTGALTATAQQQATLAGAARAATGALTATAQQQATLAGAAPVAVGELTVQLGQDAVLAGTAAPAVGDLTATAGVTLPAIVSPLRAGPVALGDGLRAGDGRSTGIAVLGSGLRATSAVVTT